MNTKYLANLLVPVCLSVLVSCGGSDSESTPESGGGPTGGASTGGATPSTGGLGGAYVAGTGGAAPTGGASGGSAVGGGDSGGAAGTGGVTGGTGGSGSTGGTGSGGTGGTGGTVITIPRGRPVLDAARTTFVADNGRPLRGPYTSSEWGDPAPRERLEEMKALGFNAVHLYAECFDLNYPNPGSTAPGYSASRIDRVVADTRELGLYLVMTIGNGANNGNYNLAYARDFWNFYAPRYANETHVIYEVHNEPVAWSPPYASAQNGALNMEVEVYNLIRGHAPDSPVLLFSYSVLWGAGAGDDALTDIRAFNQSVFGDQNATWNNLAVGFHGYAGAQNTVDAIETIMAAGYPTVMTEFHGGMWGSSVGGLDVELTHQLELLGVSWLSFVYVPPWGVSDDVSRPEVYGDRVAKTGLSWTPDFGTFPAVRGPHGNQGLPRTVPNDNGPPTGSLRIEAEHFDEGGRGVAYDNDNTLRPGQPYRASETVEIETTADAGGGYQVVGNVAGDWLEYTIKVPGGGLYDVELRAAGQGSVRVFSRDEDLTGAWALPNTGGLSTWTTANKGVFLPGGLQRLRVAVEAGELNLNWIELVPAPTGPVSEASHGLRNVGTNQSLDADNGTIVTTSTSRQWEFNDVGAGQYTLVSGGLSWTTFMGPLHLGEWYHAERFIFVPADGGNYRIVHTGGGLCLRPSTTNAPQLELAECNGDANQQWAIQ